MNTLLGYSQVWTRLSDTGGTLASDIMLGYRYYVASKAGSWGKDTAADSLWPLAETEKVYAVGKCARRGQGIFITKADYEAYVVTEAYTENVFENQNRLSELLFHTVPIDWKKRPIWMIRPERNYRTGFTRMESRSYISMERICSRQKLR